MSKLSQQSLSLRPSPQKRAFVLPIRAYAGSLHPSSGMGPIVGAGVRRRCERMPRLRWPHANHRRPDRGPCHPPLSQGNRASGAPTADFTIKSQPSARARHLSPLCSERRAWYARTIRTIRLRAPPSSCSRQNASLYVTSRTISRRTGASTPLPRRRTVRSPLT